MAEDLPLRLVAVYLLKASGHDERWVLDLPNLSDPYTHSLPAMESEAKAGSPRKASARACRRRGVGATGPKAVEAVCRAHPTRRRAIRRRVMAESDRPHRGHVVTEP